MMRWKRALVMWSAASLSVTTTTPLKGEPSRGMASFREIAAIGIVETGAAQIEIP